MGKRVNLLLIPLALILLVTLQQARWEEASPRDFNITNVIRFGENFNWCKNPPACDWVFFRDKLTGLHKAVHTPSASFVHFFFGNDDAQYFIIHERNILGFIDATIELLVVGLFLSSIWAVYTLLKHRDND